MTKRYKHLFFDLDRTLYDFDANNRQTLKILFEEFGLMEKGVSNLDRFMEVYWPINMELWESYRKKTISREHLNLKRFADTLRVLGVNGDIAKRFSEDYLELSPKQTLVVPGAHEILEYLSKKYSLYILTNGFEDIQFKKMERCNLNQYFDEVITSEQAGAQKPDSQIFKHAFKLTGAKPETSLMIGDDPVSDILGAKNQGMDQVWLGRANEVCTTPPTHQIKQLEELREIL